MREKVAERLAELSQSGFAGAVVDDLLKGGQRTAQVDVSIDQRDNITLVIARGEDAVWVEFGAGVHYNGSAGTSPHPKGSELGFTIGGYGKGMGKKDVWGFYEDGELRLTHGAPATMPMYVSFTGKTHYASSNSDRAVSCKGGKAKITQIYTKGKHPYHLVHADGGSTVYGWVDRDSFTKV